jgi:hypothetical protein
MTFIMVVDLKKIGNRFQGENSNFLINSLKAT